MPEFAERLSNEFRGVFNSLIFKESLHSSNSSMGSSSSSSSHFGASPLSPPPPPSSSSSLGSPGKKSAQSGGNNSTSSSSNNTGSGSWRRAAGHLTQQDDMSVRHLVYLQVLSMSMDHQVRSLETCEEELRKRIQKRRELAVSMSAAAEESTAVQPAAASGGSHKQNATVPGSPSGSSDLTGGSALHSPTTPTRGSNASSSTGAPGAGTQNTPATTTTATAGRKHAASVTKSLRRVASSVGLAHPLIEDVEDQEDDALVHVASTPKVPRGASSSELFPPDPPPAAGGIKRVVSQENTPEKRKRVPHFPTAVNDKTNTDAAADSAARAAREQREQRLVATRDSLTALLWVHKFSVLQLRTLVDHTIHIKWLKSYWTWAQCHPRGFACHCFLSSPLTVLISYKRYFFGGGYASEHNAVLGATDSINSDLLRPTPSQRRQARIVSTLSHLNALHNKVTESIGRIHATLHGVVSSLRSLSIMIDETTFKLPETPAFPAVASPVVSEPSITHAGAKVDGQKKAGTAPQVQKKQEEAEELDLSIDISDELEAILKRALPAMAAFLHTGDASTHSSPSRNLGLGAGSVAGGEDGGCGLNSTGVFDRQSSFGAGDMEPATPLLERDGSFGRPPQAAPANGAAPAVAVVVVPLTPMQQLKELTKSTRRWNKHVQQQLHYRYAPPRGRHWYRVIKYTMLIGGGLWWCWWKNTPTEHVANIRSSFSFIKQLLQYYALAPAQSLWSALTINRYPSELRQQALQEEVTSLSRMIVDYHGYAYPKMTEIEKSQVREAAAREDLGAVNIHYETAIQHPIRSAMFGQLFRIMLIQLQKQKVEIDRVLLTSEEVLEQNDVNFRIMALMPLAAVCTGIVWFVFIYRNRSREDPLHRRLRFSWRAIHRVVGQSEGLDAPHHGQHHHNSNSNGGSSGGGGVPLGGSNGIIGGFESAAFAPQSSAASVAGGGGNSPSGNPNADHHSVASMIDHGDHGLVLLQVHDMRLMIPHLKGVANDGELRRALEEDLDDVENTEASRAKRLRTLQRMYQTYSFLHPSRM